MNERNIYGSAMEYGSDAAMESFVDFDMMMPSLFEGLPSGTGNTTSNEDLDRFFSNLTPIGPASGPRTGGFSTLKAYQTQPMNFPPFNEGVQFPFPPQQHIDPSLSTGYSASNSSFAGNSTRPAYDNNAVSNQEPANEGSSTTATAIPCKREGETLADPTAPKKRKPRKKKNPPSEKEKQEKKERFLARNRDAARKCREKRKDWIGNLQDKYNELQHENNRTHIEMNQLLDELAIVKQLITMHGHCGDPTITQWIESERENLAQNGPRYTYLARPSQPSVDGEDCSMGDSMSRRTSVSSKHSGISRRSSCSESAASPQLSHSTQGVGSNRSSISRPVSSRSSVGEDQKNDSGISNMGTPPDARQMLKTVIHEDEGIAGAVDDGGKEVRSAPMMANQRLGPVSGPSDY